MNNANIIQDESRKALNSWTENVKRIRKAFCDTMEEGIDVLEKQFHPSLLLVDYNNNIIAKKCTV